MRTLYAGVLMAILCMGLMGNTISLAGLLDNFSENVIIDQSFDRLRHFSLQDAVPVLEEGYGYTVTPEYQPLAVHWPAFSDSKMSIRADTRYTSFR